MKKTIFDLNFEDEFKLMKKLIKTPYGSQYFKLILFSVIIEVVALIVSIVMMMVQYFVTHEINYTMVLAEFLIIFNILMFALHSKTKWMDLVKKYYDETNKK